MDPRSGTVFLTAPVPVYHAATGFVGYAGNWVKKAA
jgi:hypothetical protein